MSPATWPRDDPRRERLLSVDPRAKSFSDHRFADLPKLLRAGDLVVVNDAATAPASLLGATRAGEPIEARLFAEIDARSFDALLFGAGDWRTKTEHRPPPPRLEEGATIRFAEGDVATVEAMRLEGRVARLRFETEAVWPLLYRVGRPIQYAYLDRDLELWHVQTIFASRPWSFEMPSAARAITAEALLEMRERGVTVATITHAAGLSSTGDARIDAMLPFPERYAIPEATARAIEAARRAKSRVVAIGTTVTRALEGCAAANDGRVIAGEGVTDLVLDARHRLRVVDGILTGMHEPSASHFRLLEAFAPRALLDAANDHAEAEGYLAHEFGDATLVLAS